MSYKILARKPLSLPCQFLACLPFLLIIHVHALSLLHDGVNLVADFLLGVHFRSVELLGDVDVEASGRYCLLLPCDKLVVKLIDNVSPDVDELPFDFRIPLRSWFLAFGCHRSLLRSHTITVTMAAIVMATFMAQ